MGAAHVIQPESSLCLAAVDDLHKPSTALRLVGGRCEDCGAPAPFPSDLCVACVKRRRDAGEAA
jgi:uncharacterized OB-fold protein